MNVDGYEEKYGGRNVSHTFGSRNPAAAATMSRKRKFSTIEFEDAPQMIREYLGPNKTFGPSLPPGFVRSTGTQCLPIVMLRERQRVFANLRGHSR